MIIDTSNTPKKNPLPISEGGTGATSASAARTAIGAVSSSDVSTQISNAMSGTLADYKVVRGSVSIGKNSGRTTISYSGFSSTPMVFAIATYATSSDITPSYYTRNVGVSSVSSTSATIAYSICHNGASTYETSGTLYYMVIGK